MGFFYWRMFQGMITNFLKKQIQKQKRRIFKKISHALRFSEKIIMIITGLAMILDLLFPQVVSAETVKELRCFATPQIFCEEDAALKIFPPLEISKDRLGKVFYVTVTAYSSTPDQTDSTPFITANGSIVGDGIAAANFLPFKAKIKFPEVFGDKIFSIEDRMNRRFSDRIDIWMPSRAVAKKFGVKKIKVEVLENEITKK